jgi:hypothetical protein
LIPKDLAEDSMFPFKGDSVFMKVSFVPGGPKRLIAEPFREEKNY